MSMLFTIDASVFVASYRRRERDCAISRELLQLVREAGIPLIEPSILPVEIAAALAHAGENPEQATEFAECVMNFPYISLRSLDDRMARRAMMVATQYRLRGADALYVSAAAQYGARLVTLDAEQLERAPASIAACKPNVAVEMINVSSVLPPSSE